MNRQTILELINQKLETADDKTLLDVLLVLSDGTENYLETGAEVSREIDTLLGLTDADKNDLDDWDKQMIADSKAGKFDKLIDEMDKSYRDGNYEILVDGLKKRRKPNRPLLKPPKTKEEAKAQIKLMMEEHAVEMEELSKL